MNSSAQHQEEAIILNFEGLDSDNNFVEGGEDVEFRIG